MEKLKNKWGIIGVCAVLVLGTIVFLIKGIKSK